MAEVYDKMIQRPTTLYLRRLTRKQQKTLREFDEYNERKNFAKNTREHQLKLIGHLGDDIKKEYQDMNKNDVNKWLDNKNIIPNSRQTYQLYLQKFLTWSGKDINGWFEKIENAYNKTIPPSDLWTLEEINEMIIRYPEVQYRALVATLSDSETRVSEICSMNIQDVEFVAGIATIFIRKSKTQERRIELIFATKELVPWYNLRKEQAKPTDPLWISKCNRRKNQRLTQGGVYEILKYGKKLLGTNKHIYPHLLRHSMASHLRKNGYPDALHRKRMGLSPGSTVLERYTHVSDMEVSNGARIAFGAEPIQKKAEYNPLLPKKCPRCGTDNRSTNTVCSKCFYSIDYENTEKEVTLVEMFRSDFAKFKGIDLDSLLNEFQQYKGRQLDMTKLLQRFLSCFNGGDDIQLQILRRKLSLDESDAFVLMGYLVVAELIEIEENTVKINSREEFEKFIPKHEHCPSIIAR